LLNICNMIKLIAETAWHHDGDFSFFKKLVENIATKTDTDFIKFHITLDVDEYMHYDHPAYKWVKERILSERQWEELFKITLENNKKLMLLLNDTKAIKFGLKFKPELVEIHSVCLNDIKLLKHLSINLNEEMWVVLGIGGTDLYEIEHSINIIDTSNIILMHGFQNYPTKYEDINFSKIKKIVNLYPQYPHGYADHTFWDNNHNVLITLLGAALGMDFIEKHITIVPGEKRPDWQSAISINQFNDIQKKLKILSLAYGNGLLEMNDGEKSYSVYGPMKKSAILNKDVRKGEVFKMKDFDFKRTGQESDLSQLEVLSNIGHKYVENLNAGQCVRSTNLK